MNMEQMIEIDAIKQLKYRYIRGIDTQDFDMLTSCFIEDASVWYQDGLFQHTGRDAIIAFMRALLVPELYSSHIVTQPEIELTGPTTAKGVWRLEDVAHLTQDNSVLLQLGFPLRGGARLEGAAYYYDDYVKQDGWKIGRSGYARIFETFTSSDGKVQLNVGSTRGRRSA